jgi:hypothetical protein
MRGEGSNRVRHLILLSLDTISNDGNVGEELLAYGLFHSAAIGHREKKRLHLPANSFAQKEEQRSRDLSSRE